jgi:hypothetical protein
VLPVEQLRSFAENGFLVLPRGARILITGPINDDI